MSCIFYKFKSQKTDSRLPIDGTGISVFDLKKEIILANHMGEGKDFDLGLYEAGNEEEYKDDQFVIPRSTSVIARRLPPARPGKGTAAIYIAGVNDGSRASAAARAGQGGMTKQTGFGGQRSTGFNTGVHMQRRFDAKEEDAAPAFAAGPSAVGGDEETAKLEAMFKAQNEYWTETKETMSQATPIFSSRGGRGGARGGASAGAAGSSRGSHQQAAYEPYVSDKPLPPGYICYRCGQRGHWIQNCPTNDDKEFDNRPRFKRTTGIPRSFLKTVDATAAEGAAGGIMITPEGGFVVAEPDSAAWEKQRAKPKIVTESEVRESPPSDPTLVCPLCTKLFTQAVQTPCCQTNYCEECIQAHLLEHDFVCPNCDEKIGSLDRLVENGEMRERVERYIVDEIERRKFEEEGQGKSDVPKEPSPPPVPKIPTGPAADAAAALAQQQQQEAMYQQHIATYGDPQVIQNSIQQNMIMLSNPGLPPPARMQLTHNLQNLQQQLAIALNAGMMLGAGFVPPPQQQQQQQFNGQQQQQHFGSQFKHQHQQQFGANGNQRGGRSSPNARPVLTPEQQANERLLVNGRRRGLKREAPTDSEGGGPSKMGRF